MPNKNFVIIVPDSNGDRSALVLNLEADSHSALDEHTVRRACDQGIQNYLDSDNPGEPEDHITHNFNALIFSIIVLRVINWAD